MNEKPWVSIEQALETIKVNNAGRTGHRFVILGAGMAGLAAALELIKLGHHVQIIEGSNRVGGRVWTERFKANNTYAERGPMRVPLAHDYTYHYIHKVGLTMRRFLNSTPGGLGFYNVTTVARMKDFQEEILPNFKLVGKERCIVEEEGPGGLLNHYMTPLMKQLGENFNLLKALVNWDLSNPTIRETLLSWDRKSWFDYLKNDAKASSEGLRLIGLALSLNQVWEWSLAAALRDELHQRENLHQQVTVCEIVGGFDQLPEKLKDELPPNTIRFNTEVTGIENRGASGGAVHLRDVSSGKTERLPFTQLLCTLPFTILRRLKNQSALRGFSQTKLDSIDGLGKDYVSSTKILFSFNERWWENGYDIKGGRSISQDVLRQAYYPCDSLNQPCVSVAPLARASASEGFKLFDLYTGDEAPPAEDLQTLKSASDAANPGTVLASYTLNQGSKTLRGLSSVERKNRILSELQKFHPTAPEPDNYLTWCWDQNRWSSEDPNRRDPDAPGGAMAITHPGTFANCQEDARKPEGRIYFAGEHLSLAPGWIQGALESTLREVAKIVKVSRTDEEKG
jgi:monoamine oxidase